LTEPLATVLSATWIVAFDGRGHRILRDGELAFEANRIIYVGPHFEGPVGDRIDGAGCLAIPGLINCHVHANTMALHRLHTDVGRPGLLGAGWLETLAPRPGTRINTGEPPRLAADYTVAELLSYGTTTFVEAGAHQALLEEVAGAVERIGIRAYLGPPIRSAEYVIEANGQPGWVWEKGQGERDLAAALRFIERHDGAAGGRIRGILIPRELEVLDETTLRAVRQAAGERALPIQMHACQNASEFYELLKRHGCTPIEFLERIGFLAADVTLGHCIFTSAKAPYPGGRDLDILATHGVTIAHCPLGSSRRGFSLDSFDRCRAAGINLALGTDAYPRDMISELRHTALMAKLRDASPTAGRAADVFDAATLGGATALGRDDLGRLCPGAKADIVLVDFGDLRFGPVWDPIKTLVDCATGDNVRTVIVDGRVVMRDRRITGVDRADLLRQARAAAQEAWRRLPSWDYLERSAAEVSPPSFPDW
jgi:5-methylthioadenosine/S-adenosylhomocysteine deaminase